MAAVSESAQALMSIGEVLVRLREEFRDVSISKIRFLESHGLVHPARTPSGYRKFSIVDVERLRYILRMQLQASIDGWRIVDGRLTRTPIGV